MGVCPGATIQFTKEDEMLRRYTAFQLLLVAVLSSIATIGFERLVDSKPVMAQGGASGPLQGVTVFAGPRRDTEKDESFIFVSATGEIWVYRNEKFEEHYRVTKMGAPLEKVK